MYKKNPCLFYSGVKTAMDSDEAGYHGGDYKKLVCSGT
jgi:hypothetical protein